VLRLLRGLPADQRDAVQARVVDERPHDEIAAELRCSQSVVRKRVSRGAQSIRVKLKEAEQ
jgi:RNA polymerase sigma factor (sigma-70 family)